MAKKSMIARENKRIKLINKFLNKRNELKNIIKSGSEFSVIAKAQEAISKVPINSNPVRHNTRCLQCGRPHAVYKKFKLCRICIRKHLMAGDISGGRKSSW